MHFLAVGSKRPSPPPNDPLNYLPFMLTSNNIRMRIITISKLLQHRHSPILALFSHQPAMRPGLYNTPMIKNMKLFSVDNGVQAVGNDDSRSPFHRGLQCTLDQLLGGNVQGGGDLIEQTGQQTTWTGWIKLERFRQRHLLFGSGQEIGLDWYSQIVSGRRL